MQKKQQKQSDLVINPGWDFGPPAGWDYGPEGGPGVFPYQGQGPPAKATGDAGFDRVGWFCVAVCVVVVLLKVVRKRSERQQP